MKLACLLAERLSRDLAHLIRMQVSACFGLFTNSYILILNVNTKNECVGTDLSYEAVKISRKGKGEYILKKMK